MRRNNIRTIRMKELRVVPNPLPVDNPAFKAVERENSDFYAKSFKPRDKAA